MSGSRSGACLALDGVGPFPITVLPKLLASWLIVLVLAPFTAPFSTCDLASLGGRAPGKHGPLTRPVYVALTRDAAAPCAPVIPAGARTRFSQLAKSPLSGTDKALSSPTLVGVVSVESIGEHGGQVRILRL